MKPGRLTMLILVFFLLAAYVFFYEVDRSAELDKTRQVEKALYIDPEDAQEIVLKKEGISVSLKRDNGQWRVIKPVQRDADNEKVNDLLTFFDYGIVREIESMPSDLGQYGLDTPKYEFWIRSKGEDTFRALLIGDDAPGNISCYGKVKAYSRVILLGVRYRQELDRAITDFSRASDG